MPAASPAISVLGGAILQRLTRAPMSGYELKKLFTTSAGYGWHAYDTQIYRELKALERHGLVHGRAQEGRAGPRRRVYTPTPLGLAALRGWLESPLDETWHKSELTMRIWALDLMSRAALDHLLAEVRRQTLDQLEHMQGRRDELRRRYGPPELCSDPRQVGRQLVLEYDIEVSRLKLAWMERVQTIARLQERLGSMASDRQAAADPLDEPASA
jgi:PadR family transcriptional regulator, regulatory protein AphA